MNRVIVARSVALVLLLGAGWSVYAAKFTPPPGQGYSWDIHRQFPNYIRSQMVSDTAGTGVVYDWASTKGFPDPATTMFENFTDHVCPGFQGGSVMLTNRTSIYNSPFAFVEYGKGWGSCPLLPNQ